MSRSFLSIVAGAWLVLVAGAGAPARAATTWTVTTATFERLPAAGFSLDEAGAHVRASPDAPEQVLGWDQFLSAERQDAVSAPSGRFSLFILGGDRISGEPAGIEGESLRWKSVAAGDIAVPLKRVSRIVRAADGASSPVPSRAVQTTEDVVTLANGDAVRGIIQAMGEAEVSVQAAGGDAVPVPLDSITSIRFASTAQEAPESGERAFRIRFADGSVLKVPSLRLKADRAELTLEGAPAPRSVATGAIIGIEQVNGPVAWLSSLAPAEDVQTPWFGASAPARMDRSVTGNPIRFADKTYARGIGVHAFSRMTWRLDGRYNTFRTRYAMDGDLPYANVTVRVRLDDGVVYEKPDVVAGELSPVIEIPLKNAKTITLEVDYGQTYDVQDRLNWIEPALLKAPPAASQTAK